MKTWIVDMSVCVCGCGVQSKSKADVMRVMVTVVEMIRIVKKMRMAVMPEIRLLMMMVAMIGFGFVARNIRSVGQQPSEITVRQGTSATG